MRARRDTLSNRVSNQKTQDIQDAIFRKMSAEEKIKLASEFYEFAQILSGLDKANEARKSTYKNRSNP